MKSLNRKLLLGVLLLYTSGLRAQCQHGDLPFSSKETLKYSIFYNWKNIWQEAGTARFEARDTLLHGQRLINLTATGTTLKKYDLFFKVRDKYQSIVEPVSLRPMHFIRKVREGSLQLNNRYKFDYTSNKALYITKKNKEAPVKGEVQLVPCTFDVLSAIYHTRALDFERYQPQDTIPITFLLDREIFESYILYLGKKNYTSPKGDTYTCHVFKPNLIEGTIFKGGLGMEVWVTADEKRLPLYIESQIIVGTVRVYLTEAL